MNLHTNIKKQLDYFYEIKKIPNIIFYGNNGSGKKTLLNDFLLKIYQTPENIHKYTMIVNCAHGKGIKFIREELKFFAKTQINFTENTYFKSIGLLNADKLTIDAQSALRRCIELFNHSTRFFITLEDKNKLLKPILSRFSLLYIPTPVKNKKEINLYQLKIPKNKPKKHSLEKIILLKNIENIHLWFQCIEELYEEGFHCLDLLFYIQNDSFQIEEKKKYEILFQFHKIKKEIRNEKLLMLQLITLLYS